MRPPVIPDQRKLFSPNLLEQLASTNPATSVTTPADTTYDMALDVRRQRLYVANYAAGVAVVDFSDPQGPEDATFLKQGQGILPRQMKSCAQWGTATKYGLIDAKGDTMDTMIPVFKSY